MTEKLDFAISQNLAALAAILNKLGQNNLTQYPQLKQDLTAQIQQLESQLQSYPNKHFSDEFYEDSAQVIEQVTELRLNTLLRKALRTYPGWEPLNQLVAVIAKAVYQHEALTGLVTEPAAPIADVHPIEAAQARAEAALHRATAAAAAAEQANQESLKILEQLKREQQKSPDKLLSAELVDRSIAQTVTMQAKNTASALAADEAAAAMTDLEDLLNLNDKDYPK